MRKISAYQTDDGRLFPDRTLAVAWEARVAAGGWGPLLPTPTIPKLQALVDLLYELPDTRKIVGGGADAIEDYEKAIKAFLIDNVSKEEGGGGIVGRSAKCVVKTDTVPTATDWDAVYRYIKKNNRFDLIQRRLSTEAIREIWDAGKDVPGVGKFTAVKLSITKV